MGYYTDFEGAFKITPRITDKQMVEIHDFCESRHEGSKFPGIWCDYRFDLDANDNTYIFPRSGKNYCAEEWLYYLIEHYFEPWGYKLNGEVFCEGEAREDVWRMVVKDNEVTVYDAIFIWEER